jgi:hypothetical protein
MIVDILYFVMSFTFFFRSLFPSICFFYVGGIAFYFPCRNLISKNVKIGLLKLLLTAQIALQKLKNIFRMIYFAHDPIQNDEDLLKK